MNQGFDSFRLMDKHNDMRAMLREMHFSWKQPCCWLRNVGETHIVGGKAGARKTRFFNPRKLKELRARQVQR